MPITLAKPNLLEALYSPIARELAEVESRLKAELQSDYPFVDELVRYGCLLGGKRLRPALVLLTAKAVGGRVASEHLTLATVVEMIHTATLVHDDVLDEAQIRRHLATVNARWDNEASVLLGDFLFTHAFYLASTLDSVQGCRLIGRATNIVCEGELRQKGSRGNFELSEIEYLEIIEAKTAELTAVSCRLGALYARANEELVEQLDGFGRDLGIAFQIADDLLDVQGEERATGKSLGTDLEKQKPTLPVIRALELATPADREAMLEILADRESENPDGPNGTPQRVFPTARPSQLAPYLERYEALDYAKNRGQAYAHRARQRLELLAPSPERDVLATMTEFVMSRSA
jgi:octaprenyl-diphosphate synthase